VEYVRFGNTGLMVSRLCMGAMEFPKRCDERTSIRIVHKAMDNGINFFDTANYYADHKSEVVLGKAVRDRRGKAILATKFWAHMYDDPNGRGCSRQHVMRSVEDSLRRFRSDYIDLVQLHHPDPHTPVEETLSTLDSMVKQGKIRYIGVANHYAWQVAHMLGVAALHNWDPVVSLQCRYCLTDRAVELETMAFCRRFNIATLLYGPLEGGILTGKYKRGKKPPKGTRCDVLGAFRELLTDDMFDILDLLREVAEKNGALMAQVAIKWLLSRPGITCPIIGGSRPEHFEIMYDIDKVQVPDKDLKRLTAATESRVYRPHMNQPIVMGAPDALNWW